MNYWTARRPRGMVPRRVGGELRTRLRLAAGIMAACCADKRGARSGRTRRSRWFRKAWCSKGGGRDCSGGRALLQADDEQRAGVVHQGPVHRPHVQPDHDDASFGDAGGLAMEAENFYKQEKTFSRMWQLVSKTMTPRIGPDSDRPHVEGASEDAYLELLPDVRQKDEDGMHSKASIAPEGGRDAVLSYMIRFTEAGRYFVWVRALAVDGTWPESGKKLTFQGRRWSWSNTQRDTKAKIAIEIPKEGIHQLQISMRRTAASWTGYLPATRSLCRRMIRRCHRKCRRVT